MPDRNPTTSFYFLGKQGFEVYRADFCRKHLIVPMTTETEFCECQTLKKHENQIIFNTIMVDMV